jgi:type II secretory pathway pseudopilin PulG
MTFLLIAAMIVAMILLYVTDRVLKARARARRYRAMSERLDAAAARTDMQQEQRKTAAAVSAALTSVMPAINRPPLTLPGVTKQQRATPACEAKPGREATGPRDHRPAHPGDKQAHAGDKQAHAGEETAHSRPRPAERSGRAGHATGPRQQNQR